MIYGFIGCGKMATALVEGAVETEMIRPEHILLTDTHAATAAKLGESSGAKVLGSSAAVAAGADAIILCVKPGDALEAVAPLRAALAGKLLISIVAGLPLSALREAAGEACRCVRVMPNTPAVIRQGVAAYAIGPGTTGKDQDAVATLFGGVGQLHAVKEELLDAVTGLSGSGPAYVFLMIEALADGGVLMGLPRAMALRLAAGTVAGAAEMVLQSTEHPAVLREAVTSPGGTTAAGLEALESRGARAAFLAAVRAATERSQQMGRR